MDLLITGGTGFFGRALLRYLIADNNCVYTKIFVLSRSPRRFLKAYPEFRDNNRIKYISGDVLVRSSLPWALAFNHVIHAASDTNVSYVSPLKHYYQIFEGTRNILDLSLATGADRFLLASSGAVYGQQPPTLKAIPESWDGAPDSTDTRLTYGNAKRAAEHLCSLVSKEHGLHTIIARCFSFIGPDLPLNGQFAIGNFIHDALSSEVITIHGDGTQLRTYLEQTELAHWLITLLNRGLPGNAYNVGSDEVVSILRLARIVRDTIAPEKKIVVQDKVMRPSSHHRYIPDITKISEDLDLSVKIPLQRAILKTQYHLQMHK